MHLRFACPTCDGPNALTLPGPTAWTCAGCGVVETLPPMTADHCALCGCGDRYRQKDFPQWLGMSLLTVACLLFFAFAIFYQYAIAWTILLGSAAFDGLVYLLVGDVVICYRCGAQHKGVPSKGVDPFDLATNERYRQERLRREELQATKRS